MDWNETFLKKLKERDEESFSYKKIIDDFLKVKKNNNFSIQLEMNQIKQQKQKMVDNMLNLTNYLAILEKSSKNNELNSLYEEKKALVLKLEDLVFNRDKNINKILEEIQKKNSEIEIHDEKRTLLKKMNNLLRIENEELNYKLSLLENQLANLQNNCLPIFPHKKLKLKGIVRRIVIHPNSSIFGIFTGEGFSILDIETGSTLSEQKLKSITSLSFQNDFVSITTNYELYIYNILNLEKYLKYLKDDNEIFKGEFLLEKNQFLTCHKNFLKIWDFEDNIFCLKMIKIQDYGLDISLSTLKIVTCHVNDVYVWDHQFQLLNVIKTNKFITSISVNNELILITHQSSLELFSFHTQKSQLIIHPDYEAGCLWNKAIFSACNEYIIVGTIYGTILFWKLSDLSKPFHVLKSNDNRITSVGMSLNSKMLITSSIDNEVKIFKN